MYAVCTHMPCVRSSVLGTAMFVDYKCHVDTDFSSIYSTKHDKYNHYILDSLP